MQLTMQNNILALPAPLCDCCEKEWLNQEEIEAPAINEHGERMCERCEEYYYYCSVCDTYIYDGDGQRCNHVFWDTDGVRAGVGDWEFWDRMRYDEEGIREHFLTAVRVSRLHWPILTALRAGRVHFRISSDFGSQSFEMRLGASGESNTSFYAWNWHSFSDCEIEDRAEEMGLDLRYVADSFQWLWGLGEDTQKINFIVAGWIYEDLLKMA